MTESAALLSVATRQPPLAEERCSLREKAPTSEAPRQASLARCFERRDQTLTDSELSPAAKVMNSRVHANGLSSLTHAKVLHSTVSRASGYSRSWPRSP
jgi:hypothetical protein